MEIVKKNSLCWHPILNAGLVIGVLIVLSDLLFVQWWGISNAFLVLFFQVFGIIFAQRFYREVYLNKTISYAMALKVGTLTMGAVGFIRAVYYVVLFKLKPSVWDSILLNVESVYFKLGVPDADVALMLDPIRGGISPVLIIISFIISSLITGFFISLITSIYTKRDSVNV